MTISYSKAEQHAHRIRESMTPAQRQALARMSGVQTPEWDALAGRPKPGLRVVGGKETADA